MTRHFACRAVAWPFARLAIVSFYVYGLMSSCCVEYNNLNCKKIEVGHWRYQIQ